MTQEKQRRLADIARELRGLRRALPDAIKLRVDNALLIGTNNRLIGEIEARDRNISALQRQIMELTRK